MDFSETALSQIRALGMHLTDLAKDVSGKEQPNDSDKSPNHMIKLATGEKGRRIPDTSGGLILLTYVAAKL